MTDFQSTNSHAKMQSNGYVSFFSFIKSSSRISILSENSPRIFNFLLHIIQFHISKFLIYCYAHIFCMTSEQIFFVYRLEEKFQQSFVEPLFTKDCIFRIFEILTLNMTRILKKNFWNEIIVNIFFQTLLWSRVVLPCSQFYNSLLTVF